MFSGSCRNERWFKSKLVKIVKKINVKDPLGEHGSRSILFSIGKMILNTLTLHERRKIDHQLRRYITTSHPETRAEATISVNSFTPNPLLVPASAQYYRVVNHLSIISDYAYNESNRKYEALNPLDTTSVFTYSDYIPVNTPLTMALKAEFPSETVLTDSATVMPCVVIVYYIKSGVDVYFPYTSGTMLVYDVF